MSVAEQSIDGLWLALYRIGLGACLLWQIWKFFSTDLIYTFYIEPRYHFTWLGLDFVKPWPGQGMYVHFGVLAVAASCILVGFHYRLAAFVFCAGYTWVFLIDQCWYLNHYYLLCLLSFLSIFLPANRELSIDAFRKPSLRREWTPRWTLWVMRYQLAIPYVFGGIAKLNSDWLHGEPMRSWLAVRTDFPVIGEYFTAEWCVQIFVFGGMLLDLTVIPLLLWRRTRLVALLFVISFHLLNARLFTIGIFPWLMIWSTSMVFLPPEVTGRLRRRTARLGNTVETSTLKSSGLKRLCCGLLGCFLCWQTLMPLRHHFYGSHTAFTREGHQFSWRMKLNTRRMDTQFSVTDSVTGLRSWLPLHEWITSNQERKVRDADHLLQLARWIEHDIRQSGGPDQIITVDAWVMLNGRPPNQFVDPQLDLSQLSRTWTPSDWIVRQPTPLSLSELLREDSQ
ncbi:MAG: HTTM domain-containing protein [Fuerstiella sp.]|nr:HTTM domain-containing protein [Fuerstiella sp.]